VNVNTLTELQKRLDDKMALAYDERNREMLNRVDNPTDWPSFHSTPLQSSCDEDDYEYDNEEDSVQMNGVGQGIIASDQFNGKIEYNAGHGDGLSPMGFNQEDRQGMF
jgi:hypothetical protein